MSLRFSIKQNCQAKKFLILEIEYHLHRKCCFQRKTGSHEMTLGSLLLAALLHGNSAAFQQFMQQQSVQLNTMKIEWGSYEQGSYASSDKLTLFLCRVNNMNKIQIHNFMHTFSVDNISMHYVRLANAFLVIWVYDGYVIPV